MVSLLIVSHHHSAWRSLPAQIVDPVLFPNANNVRGRVLRLVLISGNSTTGASVFKDTFFGGKLTKEHKNASIPGFKTLGCRHSGSIVCDIACRSACCQCTGGHRLHGEETACPGTLSAEQDGGRHSRFGRTRGGQRQGHGGLCGAGIRPLLDDFGGRQHSRTGATGSARPRRPKPRQAAWRQERTHRSDPVPAEGRRSAAEQVFPESGS